MSNRKNKSIMHVLQLLCQYPSSTIDTSKEQDHFPPELDVFTSVYVLLVCNSVDGTLFMINTYFN